MLLILIWMCLITLRWIKVWLIMLNDWWERKQLMKWLLRSNFKKINLRSLQSKELSLKNQLLKDSLSLFKMNQKNLFLKILHLKFQNITEHLMLLTHWVIWDLHLEVNRRYESSQFNSWMKIELKIHTKLTFF